MSAPATFAELWSLGAVWVVTRDGQVTRMTDAEFAAGDPGPGHLVFVSRERAERAAQRLRHGGDC